MNWSAVIAGVAGLAIGGSAVAISGAGAGRAEIEGVVRDYLLANPEIVTEAQTRLQDREVGKLVAANRALFETPFGSAWQGARDGDVVLVEFFDYACGYCRRSNADVDRLLAEDKRLKVVWRELPVLGQDSLAAAEASLAAAEQGKFRPFFDRLFAQGRPTAPARAPPSGSPASSRCRQRALPFRDREELRTCPPGRRERHPGLCGRRSSASRRGRL
jgi:protein-disulfide isomerase